jgi:mannose/cellobiose epimerase-like protein (N-acyl-D-glucosamine 2-epimerase family)
MPTRGGVGGEKDETAGYSSTEFLMGCMHSVLEFWSRTGWDAAAGCYLSDRDAAGWPRGTSVSTVSTARFLYMFATGNRLGLGDYTLPAERCVRQLEAAADPGHGGYFWELGAPGDGGAGRRKVAYAHAFVLLGMSAAVAARLVGSSAIEPVVEVIESHFRDVGTPLVVEEASADWTQVPSYRGQNANMHLCEAYLEAFQATGDYSFLERAKHIASAVVDLVDLTNGLVWEHYGPDWDPDWHWAFDGTTAMYHPSGYVPGHWLEWAKLLLALATFSRREEAENLQRRALALYEAAWQRAWDSHGGGFAYTLDLELNVSNPDRHHWPQAEGIAAAARLASVTGEARFRDDYDRLWAYVLENFVTEQGAWRKRTGVPGGVAPAILGDSLEPDYHSLSACYAALQAGM